MESNNEQKIRELLERYFDGDSTLEEEAVLKAYFKSTQHLPSDMEYARSMFGYFDVAAQQTAKGNIFPAPKVSMRRWISIAASIAIIVTTCLIFYKPSNDAIYCYVDGKPVNDYHVAMEQSMQAFHSMSKQMNNSTKYLSSLNSINTSVTKSLDYLSGVIEGK